MKKSNDIQIQYIYLAFLSIFIHHFIDVQQKLFHLIICWYVVLVGALEKVKTTGSYLSKFSTRQFKISPDNWL